MSKAKPRAAMAQISHCRGVRRGAAIGGESLSGWPGSAYYWTEGEFRIVRFAIVLLLSCCAIPRDAGAQTSATLAGRINDSTGGVVPGATITARHLERSIARIAVSDADGRYVIAALPVGMYDVRVELSGFKPAVRQGVTLTVNQSLAVDFTLELGGVVEAVNVVGDASPVNTRTGELSYLVDERTIEQLPLNGRNYTDLAFLQPGVTPYPFRDGGSVVAHGLGMSVNGQDPRANVYLLDGTLLNEIGRASCRERGEIVVCAAS